MREKISVSKSKIEPSDLELYDRWFSFWFHDRALSDRLPPKAMPEEQVAAASLYGFSRLDRYHGGQSPYRSWHPPFEMPIVTMSPVLKLREGSDFAFGARWALMQYYPWKIRREFLDVGDEAVKLRLRACI